MPISSLPFGTRSVLGVVFLAASAACSSSGGSGAPGDAPGNDGGVTTSDGSAPVDGAPGTSAWAPVDTQGFGAVTSMRAYGAQLYVTFERTGGTGVAVLEAGTFRELFDTAKHPTIDGATVKADLPVSLGADGSVWTGWDDGLCFRVEAGIPRDKFFGGCRSVAAVSKNEAYAAGSKDSFGEMKNGSSRFVSLPVVSNVAVVGGELYLATTDGIQKTSLPLGVTVTPSMVALGRVAGLGGVGGTLVASFSGGALATVSGPKSEMLAPRINRLVLSGIGGATPDDLFAVGLDSDGTAEPLHLGKSGAVSLRSDAGLPTDVRELQVLADGTVFARTKAGGLFQRSASPLPVAPVPLPNYTAAASIDGVALSVTAAWGFSDGSTYHPAELATVFVTAAPRAGRSTARPIAFRGTVPLQATYPATGFCASSDVEAVLEPDVAITYKTCKYAFTKRTAAAVDVHFEGMLTANGAPATYAFDVSLELPR